jgi:hypothetical protein
LMGTNHPKYHETFEEITKIPLISVRNQKAEILKLSE